MNKSVIRFGNIVVHSFSLILFSGSMAVKAAGPDGGAILPVPNAAAAAQPALSAGAVPAVTAPNPEPGRTAAVSATPTPAPAAASAPPSTPAPSAMPATASVPLATPAVAVSAPPLRQILSDSASALSPATLLADPRTRQANAAGGPSVAEEPRHALVIGNSKYKTSPLSNPGNDARAMAEVLEKLGFNVVKLEDSSLEQMQKSVREFGERLKNGGVGMFYYAGHGVQIKGNNYLVPTSSDITSEDEVQSRAYNVNEILEKMESARNRLNLVVLDACRNNPFARSFRSSASGLAQMDAPSGTLVAFSTAPGKVASDGSGKNGLYTEHLLRALNQPALRVEDVFKQVRVGVMQDTNNMQMPWENTSLTGDFYFHRATAKASAAPSSTTVTLSSNAEPAVSSRSLAVLLPIQMFHGYQPQVKVQAPSIRAMQLLPERKQILLTSDDETVRSLDMESGATLATIGGLTQVRIDPTSQRLAGIIAGGKSDVIRIADTATGKVIATIPMDEGRFVRELVFSPSGKTLVANINAKELVVIDALSGRIRDWPGFGSGAPAFLVSPDSGYLLTWGNTESNIRVYSIKEDGFAAGIEHVWTFRKHWKPLTHVYFSPNGSVVSRSADNEAFVWQPTDADKYLPLNLAKSEPLAALAFSRDGNIVVSRSVNGSLALFDMQTAQRRNDFQPNLEAETFVIGADEKMVLATTANKRLNGIDVATGGVKFSVVDASIKGMAPGGKTFLSEEAGRLLLRKMQDGSVVADLASQKAVFAGAGEQFFSTSDDGLIKTWNFNTGEQVESFRAHQGAAIRNLVAPGDGQKLLTYDKDGMLKVWAFSSVERAGELKRDQFETSSEYTKRLKDWRAPFSGIVSLADYDADTETYKAVFGNYVFPVKTARETARAFAKDTRAVLKATLQYYDKEQVVLTEPSLGKLAAK